MMIQKEVWNKKACEYWEQKHKNYSRETIKTDDWLGHYDAIIKKASTPIVDLGCGSGNDTLYLMEKGKQVIACDQSTNALSNIRKNFPDIYDTKQFSMLDTFPLENESCQLIVADLCLHYFLAEDTKRIVDEIYRILTSGGYLLMRVNSINDVNFGAGKGRELEKNLYVTEEGRIKRFFDESDIKMFFSIFDICKMEEKSMYRYSKPKQLFEVCLQRRE